MYKRKLMMGWIFAGGLLIAAPVAWAQEPETQPADSKVIHTPTGVEIKGVKIKRGNEVNVSKFDTVTLNAQDMDLIDALQLLSVQSQRNIIPSPKVSGRVTANLFDVTFYEALSAVLAPNGAGYVERGGFIYVYTLEEMKLIEEAERSLVHRIFRLDYLSGQDAEPILSTLLSTNGKIKTITPVDSGIEATEQNAGENTYTLHEIVLVRDYPENVQAISDLIDEIDTPPSQVLVEATILQASLTEDLAFGVDLNLLFDISQASLTGPVLSSVTGMLNGSIKPGPSSDGGVSTPSAAIDTTVGNVGSGKSGVKIGILTHNVAAFIRALDEVTDTVILANPKIMTLNRQRAKVLVGEKVAYVSTTATATATTQTVQFLDTGTQLMFRPFISRDGRIRLELKPSISSAEIRDGGGVALPDQSTQELTTNVLIKDGQTVVLGGLFQEQTTITRKQIPGLGNLPIAGWAFKGKDDSVTRNEVIFLITPHIVKDQELTVAGDEAMEGAEQLRLGAREGLLWWSRSKMTASHLREALRYQEMGDRDKAMWAVDKALSLDPNMLEARRLKEKLTGERTYTPSDSLIDEVVDLVVDDQVGHRKRERVDVVPETLPALPARPEGFVPGAEKASQPVPPKAGEVRTIEPPKPQTAEEPQQEQQGDDEEKE